MSYIQKPLTRESVVFFGDGDEAIFFHQGNSSKEGYYIFHLIPTPKMKWKKQIQETAEEGYDKYDGKWKKIYKKDMCLLLSSDPDFPTWLILCDWYGKEDSPLIEYFINMKQLLDRNRDLVKEKNALNALLNRKRFVERKKALHPDEEFEELISKTTRMSKAVGEKQIIEVPHDSYQEREG